jgi:cytochrome c-type biogenesis protein CcmE
MKLGLIITSLVVLGSGAGLTAVFINSASPYLKINELTPTSHDVHVIGQLKPNTLQQSTSKGLTASFELVDGAGNIPVDYTGPALSNLADAKQVVVIGSMEAGRFHAEKMLVKCPSKYETKNAST